MSKGYRDQKFTMIGLFKRSMAHLTTCITLASYLNHLGEWYHTTALCIYNVHMGIAIHKEISVFTFSFNSICLQGQMESMSKSNCMEENITRGTKHR